MKKDRSPIKVDISIAIVSLMLGFFGTIYFLIPEEVEAYFGLGEKPETSEINIPNIKQKVVEKESEPAVEPMKKPEPEEETANISPTMNQAGIVSNSRWSTLDSVDTDVMDRHTVPINTIVISHTGGVPVTTETELARARRIEKVHVREWEMGNIDYHYLILPSGKIYQGRSTEFLCGTRKVKKDGLLRVAVLGNYKEQELTSSSKRSLIKLLVRMLKHYKLNISNVKLRSAGNNFTEWFDAEGSQAIMNL